MTVNEITERMDAILDQAEAIVAGAESRGGITADEKAQFDKLTSEFYQLRDYELPAARAAQRKAMSVEELEQLAASIDQHADELLAATAKRGTMTDAERSEYNQLVGEVTRISVYEIPEARKRQAKQQEQTA